jgi:hypothetical protein
LIPEPYCELYDLMLDVREPGILARIHSYADCAAFLLNRCEAMFRQILEVG